MPGHKCLVGEQLKKAKKMLRDVSSFLEEHDIPYMLDYGTLLGIIRENRLLPWDTDMDLSMSRRHLDVFLKNKKKLWKMGYRVRVRRYDKDVGPFKKGEVRVIKVQTRRLFFFKEGNLMDIFVKKEMGDEQVYTVGVDPFYLKSVPAKFFRNRRKYEFKGKTYSVPKDYVDYLSFVYGDWKTPVKDWDFRTSDHCLKKVINPK